MKKHNFFAGPAILPESVKKQASTAMFDFEGMGLSLIEISHRSNEFIQVMEEAESSVRKLFDLTDEYAVLFLTGGASTQFFMTTMNLANPEDNVAYVDTGTWSAKAIKEAKMFTEVDIIASSKDDNYNYIPYDYTVGSQYKYAHITSNNTIFGTQTKKWPDTESYLVCDMSSDIFSRSIPLSKFGLIYAGAQKNVGPAGVTLVIVRKDILGTVTRTIPTMLDYRTHIKKDSSFNTPPVFPIYVTMLTLRWILEQGGVKAMEKRNAQKANTLYAEVDRNPLFKGTVNPSDRSPMNATFLLTEEGLADQFDKLCHNAGIMGLPGHRSVGGYRASMYNALEQESVDVLVDVMKSLESQYG